MKILLYLSLGILIGPWLLIVHAKGPFQIPRNSTLIPFMVYFRSWHRGICMGTLVSRLLVLTAGVCVLNPTSEIPDTRPISVVTGTVYRHARRGIRIQVVKIIYPKLPNKPGSRAYLLQQSVALLVLRRKAPNSLISIEQRPIKVDFDPPELILQEECFTAGWHFHRKGDEIDAKTFRLNRNMRVQFMTVVKKSSYCGALSLKLQKALDNLGYKGFFDESSWECLRDSERQAQPCHGMNGAPLICRGTQVGMIMAPDAQWSNCTGYSVAFHKLRNQLLDPFFKCVSGLFEPELVADFQELYNVASEQEKEEKYDYLEDVYDKILLVSGESSD